MEQFNKEFLSIKILFRIVIIYSLPPLGVWICEELGFILRPQCNQTEYVQIGGQNVLWYRHR